MKEKQLRVGIVNQIIQEISKHDRRFFHNQGNVASLFIDENTGKIWYNCEWMSQYNPVDRICFSVAKGSRIRQWFHGGTLEALINDFCHFIRTGEYSNHLHGYGGLYCPHWGYSSESMKIIQNKAIELGYLKEGFKP